MDSLPVIKTTLLAERAGGGRRFPLVGPSGVRRPPRAHRQFTSEPIVSLEGGQVFFEPLWAVRAAVLAGAIFLCETTDGTCEVDIEGHEVPVWHLAEGKSDADYDLVTGFGSWRSFPWKGCAMVTKLAAPSDTGGRPRGGAPEPKTRRVLDGGTVAAVAVGDTRPAGETLRSDVDDLGPDAVQVPGSFCDRPTNKGEEEQPRGARAREEKRRGERSRSPIESNPDLLGRASRSEITYHVQVLERTGVIEEAGELITASPVKMYVSAVSDDLIVLQVLAMTAAADGTTD